MISKLNVFGNYPDLETERLRLRKMTDIDAEAIYKHFSSPQVTRYMDIDPVRDVEEARAIIDWGNRQYEDQLGFRLAVIQKQDRKLIGTCGINRWERVRGNRAEIGYDLSEDYWRRGLMTEALRALLDYAIEDLHIHRVEAMVEPENISSQKLLEKLGFMCEGVLRDHSFWKDSYQTEAVFSLLEGEWNQDTT